MNLQASNALITAVAIAFLIECQLGACSHGMRSSAGASGSPMDSMKHFETWEFPFSFPLPLYDTYIYTLLYYSSFHSLFHYPYITRSYSELDYVLFDKLHGLKADVASSDAVYRGISYLLDRLRMMASHAFPCICAWKH